MVAEKGPDRRGAVADGWYLRARFLAAICVPVAVLSGCTAATAPAGGPTPATTRGSATATSEPDVPGSLPSDSNAADPSSTRPTRSGRPAPTTPGDSAPPTRPRLTGIPQLPTR